MKLFAKRGWVDKEDDLSIVHQIHTRNTLPLLAREFYDLLLLYSPALVVQKVLNCVSGYWKDFTTYKRGQLMMIHWSSPSTLKQVLLHSKLLFADLHTATVAIVSSLPSPTGAFYSSTSSHLELHHGTNNNIFCIYAFLSM